jgi:hypothetical protein
MDLKVIGWGDMDEDRGQLRALVNTVMNFVVPLGFLSSCATGSFSLAH